MPPTNSGKHVILEEFGVAHLVGQAQDHETRIRSIEKWMYICTGISLVLSLITTLVVGVAVNTISAELERTRAAIYREKH